MSETTTTVDLFVVLVHPCPYEAMNKPEHHAYRAMEEEACRRWFEAIPVLPTTAFAVQIDWSSKGPSPDRLFQAFTDRLGMPRVCRVPCEYQCPENPEPLKNYYARINRQIRAHLAAGGLTDDPTTCKTAIWGQSFEGCASGFGSAVAHGLGMKTKTTFDYRMTAPDAPFILTARFDRIEPVPDSDVEAYLFELADGRFAAFFRSCLTPQWLDRRPLALRLDPDRYWVLAKEGPVTWPGKSTPRGLQTVTLTTVQERYLVARNRTALLEAIREATVR